MQRQGEEQIPISMGRFVRAGNQGPTVTTVSRPPIEVSPTRRRAFADPPRRPRPWPGSAARQGSPYPPGPGRRAGHAGQPVVREARDLIGVANRRASRPQTLGERLGGGPIGSGSRSSRHHPHPPGTIGDPERAPTSRIMGDGVLPVSRAVASEGPRSGGRSRRTGDGGGHDQARAEGLHPPRARGPIPAEPTHAAIAHGHDQDKRRRRSRSPRAAEEAPRRHPSEAGESSRPQSPCERRLGRRRATPGSRIIGAIALQSVRARSRRCAERAHRRPGGSARLGRHDRWPRLAATVVADAGRWPAGRPRIPRPNDAYANPASTSSVTDRALRPSTMIARRIRPAASTQSSWRKTPHSVTRAGGVRASSATSTDDRRPGRRAPAPRTARARSSSGRRRRRLRPASMAGAAIVDRRRVAQVVRVGLERHAEQGDPGAVDRATEQLGEPIDHAPTLAVVDFLRPPRRAASSGPLPRRRATVIVTWCGRHEPPKPMPARRKRAADAVVVGHRRDDLSRRGAVRIAQLGKLVREADLRREEQVRAELARAASVAVIIRTGARRRRGTARRSARRPTVGSSSEPRTTRSGSQEVLDRRALLGELRVHEDAAPRSASGVRAHPADDAGQGRQEPRRQGRADDERRVVERAARCRPGRTGSCRVCQPPFPSWVPTAMKHDVGIDDRSGIGREGQPARLRFRPRARSGRAHGMASGPRAGS